MPPQHLKRCSKVCFGRLAAAVPIGPKNRHNPTCSNAPTASRWNLTLLNYIDTNSLDRSWSGPPLHVSRQGEITKNSLGLGTFVSSLQLSGADKGLCCTNRMRDSSRDSSVVAGKSVREKGNLGVQPICATEPFDKQNLWQPPCNLDRQYARNREALGGR